MNELRQVEDRERLLLTVHDYRILAEAGAFEGRPKVELIDGVILTVSPQRRWHFAVKTELARRIGNELERLGLPLRAFVEGTVELSDHNAPEPDIVIGPSEGDPDGYLIGSSARLVIEIANSRPKFDLGRKKSLYAEHGAPEYWVLTRTVIHRFWSPEAGDYRQHQEQSFGEPISSVTIPGLTVESAGLI
jgi:Uma2 family endonuclease